MTITILTGCCLSMLAGIPDKSIHSCITSPPYFSLRDYGVDGQIGLEDTPDAYVSKLVQVFREVRRTLRDDGTVWINLGDSFAGGKSHSHKGMARLSEQYRGGGKKVTAINKPERSTPDGLKPKDLIGIPWMVAFALRADGWYLRSDIIWAKPNSMPESVTDRPTRCHEHIFLLSKNEKYYYDHEATQEPAVKGSAGSKFNTGKTAEHQLGRSSDRERVEDSKRNRRSVWTVPTKPFSEAHFATYPPELIEPCVLAGCPVGGTVLDPFFGAGTTGLVADRHGRHCIGIELNSKYVEIAEKRLRRDAGMLADIVVAA